MSSSNSVNCVLVVLSNNRTMSFPILLQGKNKIINTTALIDSRAMGNFIDIQLLSSDDFIFSHLPSPIITYNVDGTENQKGTIHWKVQTTLTLENHSDPIELLVLWLNKPWVILGMPWLRKWNPRINWDRFSMSLPPTPCSQIPYHTCYLGLNADYEIYHLFSLHPSKDDWSLHEYRLWTEGSGEQINKIMISTQLAQADKPKEIPVPNFCRDFGDVFSEKTYNILPPHWPFNHTIELKDSFIPKITKVYLLNPAKRDACKAFIDEHLKTGWIVPSKSPQASPFFFIPKKDRTLWPCQDYCYLNSHTVHNRYPLPLIPELIADMKDSTLFYQVQHLMGI